MANHESASGRLVHTPYRQVFADDAARAADVTVYTPADLYKKAYQVDTAQNYTLTAIGPAAWTADAGGGGGGGLIPFWPITQQGSEDYSFVQGGSQEKFITAINLSEGVLPGACMCQFLLLIMGNSTGGSSGLEWYLMTITLAADSGGDEPWERLLAADEAAIVKQLGAAVTKISPLVNDFTLDAVTTLAVEVQDTSGGTEGDWTATVLATRSEFIPIP